MDMGAAHLEREGLAITLNAAGYEGNGGSIRCPGPPGDASPASVVSRRRVVDDVYEEDGGAPVRRGRRGVSLHEVLRMESVDIHAQVDVAGQHPRGVAPRPDAEHPEELEVAVVRRRRRQRPWRRQGQAGWSGGGGGRLSLFLVFLHL